MAERADLLRIDATGTVHPVGRTASQELRARAGEWRLLPSARDAILLRRSSRDGAVLKLAGEITTPGALCDIVALVSQSGWKGELLLFGEDSQRSFFFDAGDVLGAQTNVAEERLGETLYRFGVVTREQLEAAVQAAQESGKRLGETAIDLDFVTAEELYPMMARQVEEVFFRAVQESDGLFFFFDRFDEKDLVQRHALNAGGLLMEAARRMDEMRFFREKVPSSAHVPVPSPSRDSGGKKPPDDLAPVFAQCDGRRSIAEIGRRIGQLEFEVTRAVFQLVRGGYVHVLAPRPEGPEAIVDAFNPALAEIHRVCEKAGKGGEIRDGLSRFATGAGVFDPLFQGAGPLPDGTFRADRVAKNVAVLAGDEGDAWLVQQLYEYTGFALFHAGSLLPREAEAALNATVAEILKPLRKAGESVPASLRA